MGSNLKIQNFDVKLKSSFTKRMLMFLLLYRDPNFPVTLLFDTFKVIVHPKLNTDFVLGDFILRK